MDESVPLRVREYADQVVTYVRNALGVTLEYDSDTLPLLDHYLRSVPSTDAGQAELLQLVIVTAGAYFGEVVRRRLGGRWELSGEDVEWRMVLPTGLNFAPAGFVAAAIAQADLDDLDSEFDAPARMRPFVQRALERMGEVSVEDYYSLCGRLDTLEHVHEVLVAVAAQMMGNVDDEDDAPGEAAPEAASDDPSGRVN
ncbi:MAG TPA: hypothetical protein VM513_02090 [Kofleriaceae bacterium]|jgi:hypothetical protein|nr:hypothetical protein [Kofleriaceae bacterium]